MSKILESKHKSNKNFSQQERRVIEIIDKPEFITDVTHTTFNFKSLFKMGNFEVVDFPGLNDSTDSEDIFFNLVSDNITSCDLIVYITKADSAFISQSEVNLFKKIKLLCDKRMTEAGQYIKLCIVVNKFDDQYDSDLVQISNEIPFKITGSLEKSNCDSFMYDDIQIPIFRISSHKLLISNILTHKLLIPIPKFCNQEIQKVFKNANVITTKGQKEYIKEFGKISSKFIEFNEGIDDSLNSDEDSNDDEIYRKPIYNYKHDGDWNCFIDFIIDINTNIQIYKSNTREEWLDTCMEMIKTSNYDDGENLKRILDKFHRIYQVFENENHTEYVVDSICEFVTEHFNSEKLILTVLYFLSRRWRHLNGYYQTCPHSDKPPIFNLNPMLLTQIGECINNIIIENVASSGWTFYYVILAWLSIIYFHYDDDNDELVLKLISNPIIWGDEKYSISIFTYDNPFTLITNSNGKCKTQFIEEIYECMNYVCSQKVSLLLYICFLSKEDLKMLDINNKIPYGLLSNYLGEEASIRLKLYITGNYTYNKKFPIIFNADPEEKINIDVNRYLEIENRLAEYC